MCPPHEIRVAVEPAPAPCAKLLVPALSHVCTVSPFLVPILAAGTRCWPGPERWRVLHEYPLSKNKGPRGSIAFFLHEFISLLLRALSRPPPPPPRPHAPPSPPAAAPPSVRPVVVPPEAAAPPERRRVAVSREPLPHRSRAASRVGVLSGGRGAENLPQFFFFWVGAAGGSWRRAGQRNLSAKIRDHPLLRVRI